MFRNLPRLRWRPFLRTAAPHPKHWPNDVHHTNNNRLASVWSSPVQLIGQQRFAVSVRPPHRAKSAQTDDDIDPAAAGIDPMDESLEDDLELLQAPIGDEELDDQLLTEVFQNYTLDQMYAFIDEHSSELTKNQVIRCILLLWDNLKLPGTAAIDPNERIDVHSATLERLLSRIAAVTDDMNPDELSICLLYLSKLGWDSHHPTIQQLLSVCIDRLKDERVYFPLTALSRFAVAINAFKEIYTFFVVQDAFARLLQHLDTISTSEELRLLTIGLNSLHQLVSAQTMTAYQECVRRMQANGTLTPDKVKCLLKVIQFLNYPHWSQRNTALLRDLVLMLHERIDAFQVKELEHVFRVFQSQLEPAGLAATLTRRAQTLFEQTPTAELLACSVMYALPDKRTKLTEYAKQFIYSKDPPASGGSETAGGPLSTLFKILRYLKISNVHICDGYWSKVLHEIRTNAAERQSFVLARHCHRYMHFNNNLGGTYHHKEFERYVTGLLVDEMRTGITAYVPSKFAKVAAFIIAYGHTPNGKQMLPEFVVCRIEDMGKQFKIVDCLQISRGIQIALQMRFRKHITPELAAQLMRMETVLNECTKRHLQQPNLTLSMLNSILRAYTNRQIVLTASTRTPLFHAIMQKYTDIAEQLNSRAIREIAFNLNASKYMIPSLCASLVQYVIDNRDYVMGDTVEKVLYCCYNLGYMPVSDALLDASLHIINRDFDYMSGLSIVQACLAMNFYRALPEAIINRVFNIDFIKRLEDEIEMCYSKATYPERVLNQVMQLNRAVCLDCPAAGVPWFQQNYIEAQMSKLPAIKSKFHEDIKAMLLTYLKDQQLLKIDHVTPYGYRIDFVLHFDQNRKPIPEPRNASSTASLTAERRSSDEVSTSPNTINKVAILLMKLDAFCANDVQRLRGPEILRERHLEMLGYQVVQVNHNEWNSMYMNVPGAKLNYLKELLAVE